MLRKDYWYEMYGLPPWFIEKHMDRERQKEEEEDTMSTAIEDLDDGGSAYVRKKIRELGETLIEKADSDNEKSWNKTFAENGEYLIELGNRLKAVRKLEKAIANRTRVETVFVGADTEPTGE